MVKTYSTDIDMSRLARKRKSPTSSPTLRVLENADPHVAARPFVKWAGGKRTVVPHLIARLPERIRTYHEPFVGGGALFWALAAERRFDRAVLCDCNARLVRTYCAVRDRVDDVVERLRAMADGHGPAAFQQVRAVAIDDEDDDAAVAAWLVYLNKTAYNGLYRVNQDGRFNVPIGSYKNPQICDEPNLRACSRLLENVEIVEADFGAVSARAKPGDAVYFDPPYVPLSSTASFTAYTPNGFGIAEQVRLRDDAVRLNERGVAVVLSNHDTPETRSLYEDHFPIKRIEVSRPINARADRRGAVHELVIG
jgi:DNA adenine methylase